jgi:glycosyltransferase involved in cell wall biosynthesis
MKICIFGKYPPIQGGVSMRTYWAAHGLATLGHEVHVITNAKEVTAPYRMFMREDDWARCTAQYGTGSVEVHWTESYGKREWHIPDGTTFVSKLASIGLDLIKRIDFDLIYTHYLEPYAVAAHLVAQAAGLPHVLRTAGSDAGRLWQLPQLGPLYTHIATMADTLICGPTTARKMQEAGVDPQRIAAKPARHVNLVELFTPDGPPLDVMRLRQETQRENDEFLNSLVGTYNPSLIYIGVYGKLGKAKGTPSLLTAFKRLRDHGFPVGLLLMAHERPSEVGALRDYVADNDLKEHVCQLPFLPHWRVPEFIRRCVAVCCLEQDFPIKFHDPIIAREVLTCGGCLIGSAEVIGKLPHSHRLVDGDHCVVVDDVRNIDALEQKLRFVFDKPERLPGVGQRARRYGIDTETDDASPRWLERILCATAATGRLSPPIDDTTTRSAA